MRGVEEELRARAVLTEMQMRILQGPHAALGIEDTAGAEAVRGAFLELTKQFHPARFGRMSVEVQKLSNEVFLGIKGAHDQLTRLLGSSGRLPLRSSSPAIGAGTVRGTGVPVGTTSQVPRAGSPQAFARGTDRETPATGTARPGTPIPTSQRPTSQLPPLQRQTSQLPVPTRATSPVPPSGSQPIATPRSPTPAVGVPIQQTGRTPTPALGVSVQPTGRVPTPRATHRIPGPATPQSGPVPRPTPSSLDAVNPGTVRYSGVQPTQPIARGSMPAAPTDEQGELRQALDLLTSKNWTAARQALHSLAARTPQSKQYRALLCYARGREAQAASRGDDAAQEFQRALQLDPDLADAKQALAEVQRKRW